MTRLSVLPNPAIAFASALLLIGGAACADHDDQDAGDQDRIIVERPGQNGSSGSGARSPNNARNGGLGGPISVGEESREQYCAGSGPPVGIELARGSSSGGTGRTCTTGLAARIFQYGLCSCTDATFTGGFSIDAFDSDPQASGSLAAASVGVNEQLIATGLVDIRGSLIAAGREPLPITGSWVIDGNFQTNADLFATGGIIRFGRDLWVNGDINVLGLADVAGNVYQTPGHNLLGMSVGGQLIQRDFSVPEPCACGDDDILDIDAIVAAGIASSHNSAAGLAPGSLINIGVGNTLDLGCGRFAFSDTHLVGATVLRATGRTALFIDGDLTVTGTFGVDLGTEGELDVFITGNLLLTGAGVVGSRSRPAALRFYVGGAGDIAITGGNLFAANLYAPRSNVFVTGADDIYGSFFVGAYFATGSQVMHYDAAILRTGQGPSSCDTPPDGCEVDLDCRSPNVCKGGSCMPLLDGPD